MNLVWKCVNLEVLTAYCKKRRHRQKTLQFAFSFVVCNCSIPLKAT